MRSTIALAVIGLALLAGPAHARTGYPPHHALWTCIQRYEAPGSWHATNGRYRGGLQLHYGWGYGTSYDAAVDSQATQEWGAERAWAANGYRYSFLYGQWYKWDNADGCGTTG